ncbi:MAG TPA: hypothetical protein VH080_07465 [Gemmatimonadaceae bacterium]|jgi:hypothetical protein|nr:hypothetical protein [Gemmatimonadaceae bacterium]
MTFHFIDSHGIDWMVIPGLPADHPAAEAASDALAWIPMGFTFRASTGELRVLLRGEIRDMPMPNVAPWRVGPRLHQVTTADWEALLDQARPWP